MNSPLLDSTPQTPNTPLESFGLSDGEPEPPPFKAGYRTVQSLVTGQYRSTPFRTTREYTIPASPEPNETP